MSNMLPSGLPEEISSEELVARFITSKSQFSHGRPKGSAFIPPLKGELSICRHAGDPAEELAALSADYLPDQKVYGAAIVKASHIKSLRLTLLAKEPPKYHADIIDWPSHQDLDEQRLLRKEIAFQIAEQSRLVLFTN